ncbi:NEDD8-conjugating enzyme Ubc12 [Thelohanellus kitauei]|uniref:NEDD8-conjugating enzyme Ubc12 n=1 Tax=Thelohanellus kitauei TaxID=669202 RepID=A0A0C2IDV2_THEKT|nr:NEDD8-conjugating enzyme Ubc12 [Thelohanellus kitauei]
MYKIARDPRRFRMDPKDIESAETLRGTPAFHRLKKEFTANPDTVQTYQIKHEDQSDPLKYTMVITPVSGYYKDQVYDFLVDIPLNYPYDPPRVYCLKKIFHPNIDSKTKKVCSHTFGLQWMPTYDVNSVTAAINNLLLEPNFNEPLNNAYISTFKRTTENEFQSDAFQEMVNNEYKANH